MKTVDLFAGCGGLSIGFDKVGFQTLGYLDWDNHCIETLKTNFKKNSAVFMHGDIRDIANGKNKNIDNFLAELKSNSVDGIIGGPPCQAYSIAGRVRDPNGMKNDYRNYLFESYAIFLKELKPLFFVFENVTGLLSAKPDGLPIVKNISRSFRELGYEIPNIDKNIVIDLANLGGAQKRKRVILFGVDSKRVKNASQIIQQFYLNLKNQYEEPKTVQDAIGDLPKLYPLDKPTKRKSHAADEKDLLHTSRFHNARDIKIFNILADDIKTKSFKYKSVESIKKLYEEHVGKKSKVHKYFVFI